MVTVLFGSQDPIPDTTDTGRHLMRMESEDKGGSEDEETREELTMREMGIIFPKTEKSERNRESNGEKGKAKEGKDLTSFGISQIVNKDCLPRAEDSLITDVDTETEESAAGNSWVRCWRDRGRGTWLVCRLSRWKECCCTNTIAGAVTKTHFSVSQGAAAAASDPVALVGMERSCPERGH